MRKRVWVSGLVIVLALVAIYVFNGIRGGYQASWDSSSSVAAYNASCAYLIYVIEHDMEWPRSKEELFEGVRELGETGEILDPGVDMDRYIQFVSHDYAGDEELTVCSEWFPVQSAWLKCDERATYGGQRLLMAMEEHPEYFRGR